MNEYDIVEIFREMENSLVNSMVKQLTLKNHFKEENIQDINFSQWQVEMLSGLNDFRKRNAEIVGRYDDRTIKNLETLLKTTYNQAGLEQEREILQAIVDGAKVKPNKSINDRLKNVKGKDIKEKAKNTIEHNGAFFKANDKKLNALIKESQAPLKDSFKSILRYQDDEYRKIIFKAQVYANSGVKTIRQAIDMASKEYLQKGISHITYKDGKRVNIVSYAELCIRNSNKKAQLEAKGQVCQEYNHFLVLISQYSKCSPKCINWQNRILYNDVFNGGDPKNAGEYPLLSTAMNGGKNLFHINCKHSYNIYYPEISRQVKDLDRGTTLENSKLEQHQRALERKVREKERLKNGALDPVNKKKYELEWVKSKNELNKFVKEHNDVLRRDPWRESSLINTYKQVEDIPGLRNGEVESIGEILEKIETPKKPIVERLKDKNIEIDGRFSFDDEEIRDHLLNQMDDLSNRYNVLDSKITIKSKKENNNFMAYFTHNKSLTENSITFNKNYYDTLQNVRFTEINSMDSSWSVKAYPEKILDTTLAHEFGHLLERNLIDKHFKIDENDKDFFKTYNKVCIDIQKEILDMYKDRYKRDLDIPNELSRYSMTNSKEFFAEAFCKLEVMNDSEVALIMKEFLKKYGMLKE